MKNNFIALVLLILLFSIQLAYSFDPKKCSMCTTAVDLLRRVDSPEDRENIIKYRLCLKFKKVFIAIT
ncbi:hypothetical protein DICPUDRAFT_148086 [Dictyostelium purpureum]|uniref:Saposin B-type domain-containing protein n=1 Tax=Dictyostelium purpureum TaxID=5786 RepID=F0ZA75_DICPU|nr:uncharacterized protein DICPUDRAFT_148086 [Dictyostelium purpureum]EGC39184.1 hypothetical protein DICPUDRAFT_148086 [Dictyostelium purpureum]|eukprot:XP_003284330.1 hypothetical protein DICPUDRAFT_148086 [Dictyostelium purpureum]